MSFLWPFCVDVGCECCLCCAACLFLRDVRPCTTCDIRSTCCSSNVCALHDHPHAHSPSLFGLIYFLVLTLTLPWITFFLSPLQVEVGADIGSSTKKALMATGVQFPVTPEAEAAIRAFKEGEVTYVQLSLNAASEQIELEVSEKCSLEEAQAKVPSDIARYVRSYLVTT